MENCPYIFYRDNIDGSEAGERGCRCIAFSPLHLKYDDGVQHGALLQLLLHVPGTRWFVKKDNTTSGPLERAA